MNQVKKKYHKQLVSMDNSTYKFVEKLESLQQELENDRDSGRISYNVTLHQYVDVMLHQAMALHLCVNQVRCDVARERYVEGEE